MKDDRWKKLEGSRGEGGGGEGGGGEGRGGGLGSNDTWFVRLRSPNYNFISGIFQFGKYIGRGERGGIEGEG